jgi:hypothetical protein
MQHRINVLLQSDIVYIIWLKRASMSQAMEVEMGKDRNKLRTG